LLDSK